MACTAYVENDLVSCASIMNSPEYFDLRRSDLKLRRARRKGPRTCLYQGCTREAVRNHLLQKNSVLTEFSKDSHIVELVVEDLPVVGWKFRARRGINRAFTFKGLCPAHDNDLFRPIESGQLDLQSQRAGVLLSYRALLNEIRKKEENVRWYDALLDDPTSRAEMQQWATWKRKCELVALNAMHGLRWQFEQWIRGRSYSGLAVHSRVVRRLPICCSSLFCKPAALAVDEIETLLARGDGAIGPVQFVTIFPRGAQTYIVVGVPGMMSRSFVGETAVLVDGSEAEVVRKVSDMLLTGIEDWACEPTWFEQIGSAGSELILNEKRSFLGAGRIGEAPSFNVFEL